jgi:hypothetical protein
MFIKIYDCHDSFVFKKYQNMVWSFGNWRLNKTKTEKTEATKEENCDWNSVEECPINTYQR